MLCFIILCFVFLIESKISTAWARKTSFRTHSGNVFAESNIPPAEYQALWDFYNATNGADWDWNSDGSGEWSFSDAANPCAEQWQGIECTPLMSDGFLHVGNLSLVDFGLVGFIPDSIAEWSYLHTLDLSFNLLNLGGIPDTISAMHNLRILDLAGTELTSCNPVSLSLLSNLTYLDLSLNDIEGSFPESICKLTALEYMNFNSNYFYDELPNCIGDLIQLTVLDVHANFFTGVVPTSFGALTRLTTLFLALNVLSGTIPVSFQNLHSIVSFALLSNYFSGTIPEFSTVSMESFDIALNPELHGSIPDSLYNNVNLELLSFYGCAINGTISPRVRNLSVLFEFMCDNNLLSGTLPPEFGQIPTLTYLSFSNNLITGTLPVEWANLSMLNAINMPYNEVSGGIPIAWQKLTLLTNFLASFNHLTGSVPFELLSLPSLVILDLSTNAMSGTLVDAPLPVDTLLMDLDLGANKLSGSIPLYIKSYVSLLAMNFSYNAFSGPIPETISALTVNFLYLSDNALTGTIPQAINHLQYAFFVYLDDNYLHGTIPAAMNQLSRLQSLNLSYNILSGSIPLELTQLNTLEVLLLNNNILDGSLDVLVGDHTSLTGSIMDSQLATLQVGSNQLTGTLPDALALINSLQVFSAVSNCFTGSIPSSYCLSYSLNTLSLDGLQSASSCQQPLFPSGLSGIAAKGLYTIQNPLIGGVPSCLFEMGNLTTLHLSGNGLTGELPSDINITPTLTDLSLSHNKLHGPIPSTFMNQKWTNLDLSYNRFTSSLYSNNTSSYSANASISLEQNRLSGRVPEAFKKARTISVLEGNLFACNARESDIPTQDAYYDKYQCGSDTFNETLYAWLGVMAVVLGLSMFLVWQHHRDMDSWISTQLRLLRDWLNVVKVVGSSNQNNTDGLSLPLDHYRQVVAATDTIKHVAVLSTTWSICIMLPIYIAMSAAYGTYTHQYAWTLSAAYLSGTVPFALMFTFLLGLMCVAFGAFVWTTHQQSVSGVADQSITSEGENTWPDSRLLSRGTLLLLVQSIYALTNFTVVIGVNIAYVIIALNENGNALTSAQFCLALFKVAFNSMCSPYIMRNISMYVLGEVKSRDFVSVQLFVSLVNNILIPCFVVAVVSPSCFYNIFKAAQPVTASFRYNGKCLYFDDTNFQIVDCYSEEVITATTSYDPPFEYSYQCSSSFITYYAPAYVIMCILAGVAIPVVQVTLQVLHARAASGTRWFALLDLVLPRILKSLPTENSSLVVGPQLNPFALYFDATQHLTTLLTYLGLLLTFGAVFPPLAICFLVTIVLITLFTQAKVGRFLWHAQSVNAEGYVILINKESEGVCEYHKFRRSIYFIAVFSLLFYTLFLFDTLGDAVSVEQSYWVLIVVPLLSLFTTPCYVVTSDFKVTSIKDNNSEADVHEAAMEMPTIVDNTRNPIHNV